MIGLEPSMATPVSDPGPVARFDDLQAGRSFVLRDQVVARSVSEIPDVIALVNSAEDQARAGLWVAVALTYEAGAALDDSFPRRPLGVPGLPLAWMAAFRSRDQVPPLTPAPSPSVVDVRRRGGSEWFTRDVTTCRDLIAHGLTYQINLTDRFDGRLVGSPFDLYRSMATAQGGAFNAYIDLGDHVVVSASPELFLRLDGDRVTARPMKGTARRAARADDDERVGRELVESVKDRAENVMIVDLMRNDLSRLAGPGDVSVPALFTAERYETVWQLTSTVQAEIWPSLSIVDVLRATFPCGSVTGAPKVAAMRFIDQIEPWPRGMYCGAIGLIEPNDASDTRRPSATFNVAIRTAVIDKSSGVVEFGAGGGITWGSQPDLEDAELESKAVVLTTCRPEFRLLETLRVQDGDARNLDAHLHRMASSAVYFGFECDLDEVRSACVALAARTSRGDAHRMRILLSKGGEVDVGLDRLGPVSTAPVRLGLAPWSVRSDDVFCCHKTTNRSTYERIAREHPDADDVLLGNEHGEITETCRANLLYRLRHQWYTPPLASGGLAGIARQASIDRHEVSERVLLVDDLDIIDEFAVVSSLRGRRCATVQI